MRMKGEIKTHADKVQRRRKVIKYSKLALRLIRTYIMTRT